MRRRLRMTAELSDWLAELGEAQPATAAEVGAALVALLECEDPAGLTAVGDPAAAPAPDPRAGVDSAYQGLLETLQLVRRRVADAAAARHDAELRLGGRQSAGADPAELRTLEADLAAAGQREEQLARQSQRLQYEVNAFRSAKETAKATYTAAEAQLRVAEALADIAEIDDAAASSDSVRLREALRVAESRLRAMANQPRPAGPPIPGLLELRADPLGTDIRILFADEPAGTVTLLAVLDGREAISQHGTEAFTLAGEMLTEIRDQGWPADEDPVQLTDPGAFLTRYFPADDGSIARRADVLASIVPLSRLRGDRGLTVAEVAARSGLPADRVLAIEQYGIGAARVHEAVVLARALGARLELPGGSGIVAG